MVFGWLKGAAERKFADMQRAELQHFIDMLAGVDDDQLGLIVAVATNFRHSVGGTVDLLDPINTVDVNIPLQFVRHYQNLQKKGLQVLAPGVAVWLHTTRAVHSPSNRELVRQMWGILKRGFPHVEEAAIGFSSMTGESLDYSGYDQIPTGFEPRGSRELETRDGKGCAPSAQSLHIPSVASSQEGAVPKAPDEPVDDGALNRVRELVKRLGNDLTHYGSGVALLSLESGYSVAETASHISVVSFARNVKRAADEADLDATMMMLKIGMATLEMLKELKDDGLIRSEIWANDAQAIGKMMSPSKEALEWAEKVLEDPVIASDPVAVSRIVFKDKG
ncbi:hypothetical protein ACVNHC_16320 [Pannonibacter sp. Q-1]